jgi:hypothetical protein
VPQKPAYQVLTKRCCGCCAGETDFPATPTEPTLSSGKTSLGVQFACPDAAWSTTDSWSYTLTRVDTSPNAALGSGVAFTPVRNAEVCTFTIAGASLPAEHRVGRFEIQLASKLSYNCMSGEQA